jgi:hypothetical protein
VKKWMLILPVLLSVGAFAQNPVVATFNVFPEQSDIIISWGINPGYGCDKMDLEYSTDSLFYGPSVIFSGSFDPTATSIMWYNYKHTNPSSVQRSYYRLNLGSCGYSQIVGSGLGGNFYPNPFRDMATILFQNPSNYTLYVYIFDHNGQLIQKTPPFLGNSYQLIRGSLQAGLYFYVVASANFDIVSRGKFYCTDF